MSSPTPIAVPKAPQTWKLNPDQASRVAQDPRLHRLSRDELFIFFNPPQAKPQGNVFNQMMKSLGMPDNWLEQSFAWHPKNTLDRASATLAEANSRNRR